MRVLVIVAGAIAALVAIVLIVGWSLPVAHRVTRSVVVRASPETVFNLISRPADYPSWRSGVKTVEILAPEAGHPRYREMGKNGAILYSVDSAVPNRLLVTRIADKSLPFGGAWTYELEPSGASTTLTITENGEVYNPVFRFVSRFVMGQTGTIDQYLADVQRRVHDGVSGR